jgi:hypothetical protein
VKPFAWVIAAALSAYACSLAVVSANATPIDRALPFVAVVVTCLAAASAAELMLAVPLLIAAEMIIGDETTRLLALGAIVAAAVTACMQLQWTRRDRRRDSPRFRAVAATTAGAILLLRWLPFQDVLLARELLLLAVAATLVLVLGRTPFAVTLAVVTVLVTPAVPLRTLAFPLLVLFVAVLARMFGMPRLTLAWPSAAVLGFVMLFFAWSGIVARAFPYFLKQAHPEVRRSEGVPALPARASVMLAVPDGATSLIVSGANVARMRRGTPLGRIEPGGLAVTIGDAADWGYLRRDDFYGTHNPLPRDPAGKIRGYGYTAWVDGAGRVALPRGARAIRVTADAALPPGASLQVEGFE